MAIGTKSVAAKEDQPRQLENVGCQETTKMTFDGAFELTGHGKFNTLVMIVSGFIVLSVSMETMGIAYILPAAECDLQLTSKDKGFLSAAAFIGIVCSSYLWGYLSDTQGRRWVMLPTLVLSATFSIAGCFARDVTTLAVLRFITGIFISGPSATVYPYVGEMHISAKRAPAIAWASLFIAFALILLPGMAWVVLPMEWTVPLIDGWVFTPWRLYMILSAVWALIAAFALFFLPETPKYLNAVGRSDEALKILRYMYSVNMGKEQCEYPVEHILEERPSWIPNGSEGCGLKALLCSLSRQTLPLLRPPLLRCTFIAFACMFTVLMLSSGFYVWIPDILNQLFQEGTDRSWTVCQVVAAKQVDRIIRTNLTETSVACVSKVMVDVYPVMMGMGAALALAFTIVGLSIKCVGRRTLYITSVSLSGLVTAAVVFVPQREVAVVLLVLFLCSGALLPVIVSITVQVYPTQIRAMAVCLLYMVGRLGAVAGTNLVGVLIDDQCEIAFVSLGVISIVATMLLFLWPRPEVVREQMEAKGMSF